MDGWSDAKTNITTCAVKLISSPEFQIGICPGLDRSQETKDYLKAFLTSPQIVFFYNFQCLLIFDPA